MKMGYARHDRMKLSLPEDLRGLIVITRRYRVTTNKVHAKWHEDDHDDHIMH